jgi:hypothetical protein
LTIAVCSHVPKPAHHSLVVEEGKPAMISPWMGVEGGGDAHVVLLNALILFIDAAISRHSGAASLASARRHNAGGWISGSIHAEKIGETERG